MASSGELQSIETWLNAARIAAGRICTLSCVWCPRIYRIYRAVLTPDLEAGGYTIEVPELPGCITEADGLSEAKRMAREAIEAWLDVAALQSVRGRAHAR